MMLVAHFDAPRDSALCLAQHLVGVREHPTRVPHQLDVVLAVPPGHTRGIPVQGCPYTRLWFVAPIARETLWGRHVRWDPVHNELARSRAAEAVARAQDVLSQALERKSRFVERRIEREHRDAVFGSSPLSEE